MKVREPRSVLLRTRSARLNAMSTVDANTIMIIIGGDDKLKSEPLEKLISQLRGSFGDSMWGSSLWAARAAAAAQESPRYFLRYIYEFGKWGISNSGMMV